MRTYATQRSRSLNRAFPRWSERGPDGWGNTKTQLKRISPNQNSEDMTVESADSHVEVDFSLYSVLRRSFGFYFNPGSGANGVRLVLSTSSKLENPQCLRTAA